MTKEEKDLLLKDLCARLLYGVVYHRNDGANIKLNAIDAERGLFNYTDDIEERECKPYLRPMSSMTEEEYDDMFHQLYSAQKEFFRNCSNADTIGKIIGNDMVIYDWLTKKMFDFRCLIPKGLALAAPEGMYN